MIPLVNNLINATILYKFYESKITSDALIFSYDFAFIEIPICAYCRHGISFRPILEYACTIADHDDPDAIVGLYVLLGSADPLLFHECAVLGVEVGRWDV